MRSKKGKNTLSSEFSPKLLVMIRKKNVYLHRTRKQVALTTGWGSHEEASRQQLHLHVAGESGFVKQALFSH